VAGHDVYLTLVCERHPALKSSARVRMLDTAQHTGDEAVATPRQESDVDPAMEGGADLRALNKKKPCTQRVPRKKIDKKTKHIVILWRSGRSVT
jgi:hypothetical protein